MSDRISKKFAKSPAFREMTKAVTFDDMKFGIHVGNEAAIYDRFPMRPPSETVVDFGTGPVSPTDAPMVKAIFAIELAFRNDRNQAAAIVSRIGALTKMVDRCPEWYAGESIACDAAIRVAASFPFRPGSTSFDFPSFHQEVLKVQSNG